MTAAAGTATTDRSTSPVTSSTDLKARTDWTTSACGLTGWTGPLKPVGKQIVEDLASDGAALSRGTDHSHGRRLEEPAHGGDRGGALPVFEALSRSRQRSWSASPPRSDPASERIRTEKSALAKDHLPSGSSREAHSLRRWPLPALQRPRRGARAEWCPGPGPESRPPPRRRPRHGRRRHAGSRRARRCGARRRWSRSGRSGARSRRRLPTPRPPPDLLRARRSGRRESPATAPEEVEQRLTVRRGVPAARARCSRRAARRPPRDAPDRRSLPGSQSGITA